MGTVEKSMMIEEIEDLQARIAFQEDTIQTLNEQLGGLRREMQDMQRQMHLLYKKMDELVCQLDDGQTGSINPADERPPHY